MRSLYQRLPDDDRSLLFLRIDKRMSWAEIAMIMSGESEAMSDANMPQATTPLIPWGRI